MSNQWKIKKGDIGGGQSGKLLEGCDLRENENGTFDLMGILATARPEPGTETIIFPDFAYQGLIWKVTCQGFDHGDKGDQPGGPWTNNLVPTAAEEDGTWTAQAGSGGGAEEDDGKEDAASAYA
jgi:hypothetical protein